MSRPVLVLGVVGTLLSACDRTGTNLLPPANSDYPQINEIGELKVLSSSERPSTFTPDFCNVQEDGKYNCYYGMVSATDGVTKGGATFTFRGTGGNVCVLVDPEAVFWNNYIGGGASAQAWAYPSSTANDGDLDLFGGLSSYYTGSPGIEIGDFKGYYTDSQGRRIEIDYVECYNASPYSSQREAHSGRGAPEYCTINTTGREDILYTIVLETFKVPADDGVLSFGTAVYSGSCTSSSGGFGGGGSSLPSECTMLGEAIDVSGNIIDCSVGRELAYCENTDGTGSRARVLNRFCCSFPEMCGEPTDPEICAEVDKDVFCADYPDICSWCE